MRKIIVGLFFFGILLSFSRQSVYADICPGTKAETTPPLGQITPKSGTLTIKVTTSADCFIPNADYGYQTVKGNKNWGWYGKPIDKKTFIADISLANGMEEIGTWTFTLWYGKGTQNFIPGNIVTEFQYAIQASAIGNPTLKPAQLSYQVGNRASFKIDNAVIDQDYTFWWDGEKTRFQSQKAPSSSFNITSDQVINDTKDNKKFCMEIGKLTTIVGATCRFSTTVSFTAGPGVAGGSCDQCGKCVGQDKPPSYDACLKCIDPANGKHVYTALGCFSIDKSALVVELLEKVIGLAGGIAFLLILYGGFQILSSAGDPEKLAAGKEVIVSAISGLLFIIFSVLLLRTIGVDILKIPGFG